MTHLPIPHQPSYKWWFSVYCSKPKIQKRRWGDCGFGDGMKRGGGLVLAFPLHPSSSDPPDPRGEAWGPEHLGRAFKAKGTAELSGSPWGVPWAEEAPGVAGELSSPPRVQKPVGQKGKGQAPCLATEKRRLGWQDAGLFTVGSLGPSKPPRGTRRLFTRQGGKEPGTTSCIPPCPEWGGEGRPWSCSLSLGVQMETSYSRVSWRQRDGISCWTGMGWKREENGRRHPPGRGRTRGF